MGYHSCMGYGMHFPANQLGGLKKVWGFREYGLSRLWIMRESTVWVIEAMDYEGVDCRVKR